MSVGVTPGLRSPELSFAVFRAAFGDASLTLLATPERVRAIDAERGACPAFKRLATTFLFRRACACGSQRDLRAPRYGEAPACSTCRMADERLFDQLVASTTAQASADALERGRPGNRWAGKGYGTVRGIGR